MGIIDAYRCEQCKKIDTVGVRWIWIDKIGIMTVLSPMDELNKIGVSLCFCSKKCLKEWIDERIPGIDYEGEIDYETLKQERRRDAITLLCHVPSLYGCFTPRRRSTDWGLHRHMVLAHCGSLPTHCFRKWTKPLFPENNQDISVIQVGKKGEGKSIHVAKQIAEIIDKDLDEKQR